MENIRVLINDLNDKVSNVTVASQTLKQSGFMQQWPIENYICCLEEAMDAARLLLDNRSEYFKSI